MAKEKPVMVKGTEYHLPDGAVLHCRKPTNAIRRLLLEQPETQLRFLMEIIAAACIVRMELPENYNDEASDTSSEEFGDNVKADAWKRLDKLSLVDHQAFIEVFQENNVPTREMIERVVAAVKSGKA